MVKETNDVAPGTLYIVATPIGNLADISQRALTTLNHTHIIACEDTRVSNKLLAHYGISKRHLISYGNHNLKSTTEHILSELLSGQDVALISDAGTPLICDPGALLVEACHQQNIPVTTIPGPCAVIAALTLSGINTTNFYFGGFLANKPADIIRQLKMVATLSGPLLYYCAANKVKTAMVAAAQALPLNTATTIVREITKIYEEALTLELSRWPQQLLESPLKGEVVIIFNHVPPNPECSQDIRHLFKLLQPHLGSKNSANLVKQYFEAQNIKVNKKYLYNQNETP